MYILGTIIIVLFWILFFSIKVFSQVRSYDGWAEKNKQRFFSAKFRGPALDLSYREFSTTPYIKEYGATLSLWWSISNTLQIGGYVGGAIVQVDDLVEDPNLNHLGRRTREGLFINLQNNQKKFLYFDLEGRIGHMWQVRPGDSVPGGFHRIESELQLKAGVRIQGKESLAIPSLNLGFHHLSRGGSKYEGLKPFIGVSVAYSQR